MKSHVWLSAFVCGAALSGTALAAAAPPTAAELTPWERILEDKSLPLTERIKAGRILMEKEDAMRIGQRGKFDESSEQLVAYGIVRDAAQRSVELGVLTMGSSLLKEAFDSLDLPGSVSGVIIDKVRGDFMDELGSSNQQVAEKTLNSAALRDKAVARINTILDQERPAVLAQLKSSLAAKSKTAMRVQYLQKLHDNALNPPLPPRPSRPADPPKPQSKVRLTPTATAEPDWPKLNKTWEMIVDEAFAVRPKQGDWRHHFQYHASTSGKPARSGWCKRAKEGTYLDPQGRTVRYWTWFHASVQVSDPWDNTPPNAAGVWPQQERGRTEVLQSESGVAWQQAYIGDFGLSGPMKDSAGRPVGARCHGWLGPIHITVQVDARGDAEGGEVEAAARLATGQRSLAEAELLCKNIAWVIETWFQRPLAAGPGLKGLYFPLAAAKILPQAEDFAAEAAATVVQATAPDSTSMEVDATYMARCKTRLDRYRFACRVFGIVRGQTSETQPLLQAQGALREQIDRVMADFKRQAGSDPERHFLAGPSPILVAGADEAYEFVQREDCVNENTHWVFVRCSNTVITIEGRYVPGPPGEDDFRGAPYLPRLLESSLAKLHRTPPLPIGRTR